MIIRYLNIFLLLLLCNSAVAQLTGIVQDGDSLNGIVGVELYEINSGITTFTTVDGKFTIDLNENSNGQLFLFKEGYQIKEILLDSLQAPFIFQINKLEVSLSQIELISRRKEIFATRKLKDIEGTNIYAGKKSEVVVMDLINGNVASNVSRQIYAQITGLNIYEGSDGGLQLNIGGRGLDPNRTSNFNTRQNGYDISADVLGYPENYYTPPAEALEEIKILRGASSLQYGTQFGGMIDFKTRKIPRYQQWDIRSKQTYGSFNFFNSFNSIAYNGKKWSFNAFYNYKQGDGYRNNSEFDAHNLLLASSLYLSDKTQLDFEFTYFNYLAKQAGGLTDAQFEADSRLSTRDRNWFDVDWKLYNIKFQHEFNKNHRLNINLFGLDADRRSVGFRGNPILLNENPITALDEQDNNGNYLNPRDLILGEFKNIGAEIKYLNQYQLKKLNGTYVFGVKYYDSNNSSIQGPGSTGVDPDFNLQTSAFQDYANQSDFSFPNLNLAVFIENIFYLNEKLTVTPGLRYEHIKTQSEGVYNLVIYDLAGNPLSNVSNEESKSFTRDFLLAGIGIDYTLSDQLKYTINLSQNYRSVTFSDIRVVSPSFIIDENITDEKGYSFNTGISGRIKSRFSYDFNVYSLLYNERIGIVLDNRANRVRTNIGDAIIAGTESLLNFIPIKIVKNNTTTFEMKMFLNTSFSYSRYLNSISNNVVGNQVEFIPTANIKSGFSLSHNNLRISVQHSYISKQFSDAQNSQAAENSDFRSGIIGEIPSYQILDLSFRYSRKSLQLEAGINNLLNETYFTRRATGYPGPGIIPSDGRSFFVTVGYLFQQ